MNSQYWLTSGRSRPHCRCRIAIARGVAWMPSIVRAGSPGIRWIMKNTMMDMPLATGTSISRRRTTKVIRPNGAHHPHPRAGGGRMPAVAAGAGGSARSRRSLAEPDVLHVHVAERGDEEAVHVARGRVRVRRVVEERHERVLRRLRLDGVVVRLPLGRI